MAGAPTALDIEYTRGDDRAIVATVKKNKIAQVITGNTYELEVNTHPDADDPAAVSLFTVSSTLPGGGTDGKVSFKPTSVNTDILAKVYFYDISQITPSVHTVAKGKFKILVEINKP